MRYARAALVAVAVGLSLLPLLSVGCGTGNSCLRLSDCANGMTCQAGTCASTAASADADTTEGSVGNAADANAQAQDSTPVDAATTKDAGETDAESAKENDADTETEADSAAPEADAG